MMTVYLTLVLIGTMLGLMLTPLVSTVSSALGLLDAPGGRKVHSLSVPRVGGLAISLAAGLTLASVAALARWLGAESPPIRPIAPILMGAALVLGIGVETLNFEL